MRLFPLLVLLAPLAASAQESPPAARCGNAVVEFGEACDDGNAADSDACRNDCRLPACGDGLVSVGEGCDDGNAQGGDGCEPGCLPGGPAGEAPAVEAPPPAHRRPGLAFALSLGGSVAGTLLLASSQEGTTPAGVLGLAGVIVAPSLGQLYTGHRRHALLTSTLRVGAMTLALIGLADGLGGLFGIEGSNADRGFGLFAFGGYSLFGLMAYDIIDAPFSARRANGGGRRPRLSLLPAPLSAPGQAGLGLSLAASF
jgi:cysteine-rich repeat protein